MKIAFIAANDSAREGGSEALWTQTAMHFARQGHNVGVSIRWWEEAPGHEVRLRELGATIFHRRVPSGKISGWISRFAGPALMPSENGRGETEVILDQFSPDFAVISIGNNTQSYNWQLGCLQRGIPYVTIVQGATPFVWPRQVTADKLIRAYEGAVGNYFVSQANIELTEKQLGTSVPNAEVVRNPFNVPYEQTFSWPESVEPLRLAMVARYDFVQKAHEVMLETMATETCKSRPVRLSLYGGGPHRFLLERLIRRWELEDRVEICDQTGDIQQVWKTHHALVLPTRFEGLPLAVVEAMLCGRPVITTDVAGNTEVIDDGETGFIAKAPTTELFAETMERMWENRDRLREMGEKAFYSIRVNVPAAPAEELAGKVRRLSEEGKIKSGYK